MQYRGYDFLFRSYMVKSGIQIATGKQTKICM